MTISPKGERFEALLSEAERREQVVRRRTLLYSLIPVVLAGLLLGFTIWQISVAEKDLSVVEDKLADTQETLNETSMEYQGTLTELTQVERELTGSQEELMDTNQQLALVQADLEAANALVMGTQAELDKTTLQLSIAQEELQATQGQVEILQTELGKINQDIFFAEEQLQLYRETETFKRYLCIIEPEAAKNWPGYLYANYSEAQANVFNTLMRLQFQGVQFSIKGFSIEEGFNSPNFAVYVLNENGLLPPGYDPGRLPWEQLPSVRSPGQGDLIFYRSGYTMFNFFTEDQNCVIGMTPAGILSLQPDFAEVIGFLKVPYPNQ